MAERLKRALDDAGVSYQLDIYEGIAHGWMKPEFPVFDSVSAERGWREMVAFFRRILKTTEDGREDR